MAASDPASLPAHTWSDPAASLTSFSAIYLIVFPAMRHRTSLAPFGHTPGFLFTDINQVALNVSKLLSVPESERYACCIA